MMCILNSLYHQPHVGLVSHFPVKSAVFYISVKFVRRLFVRMKWIVMMMVVCGARILTVVIGCVDLFDNSVEAVFVVSGILDHAGWSVRFHETVRSFNVTVTVTHLVLALDVMRVKIFHIVLEIIWLRCMIVVVGVVTFVLSGWVCNSQMPEQSDKHYHLEYSIFKFVSSW